MNGPSRTLYSLDARGKGPYYAFLSIVIIGLFFRFYNLDHKVYSYDEVFTSLRISGYTEADLVDEAFNNRPIEVASLKKFQEPNSGKGVSDTIRGLAQEEPQLSPLYFVLARLWAEQFGGSIAATRSLAAVFSLLVFAGLYWICMELFKSRFIAWTAIALVAVSPIHVLFAQEARMYSLWTATSLFSSLALLRAMRIKTTASWGLYAFTFALGLYTHLITIFVAFGQAVYVALMERLNRVTMSYVLASLAGLLVFLPWILVFLGGPSEVEDRIGHFSRSLSIPPIVSMAGDLSRIVFDVGITRDSGPALLLATLVVALFVGGLTAFSLYKLIAETPARIWLFVLISFALTPALFLLKDFALGGQLSSLGRYLLPNYVFAQIAIAYFICAALESNSDHLRRISKFSFAALLSLGIVSCVVSAQAKIWWTKDTEDGNHVKVAQIINDSRHPLVVSSGSARDTAYTLAGDILLLSHLLDSDVLLQLTPSQQIPTIASDETFHDLFWYSQPLTLGRDQLGELRGAFDDQFEVKPLVMEGSKPWLWKLN